MASIEQVAMQYLFGITWILQGLKFKLSIMMLEKLSRVFPYRTALIVKEILAIFWVEFLLEENCRMQFNRDQYLFWHYMDFTRPQILNINNDVRKISGICPYWTT